MAWQKLAISTHPDRNPGDGEASAKFIAVQQAYESLSLFVTTESNPLRETEELLRAEQELRRLQEELRRKREEDLLERRRKRRIEAIESYHNDATATATLRGCHAIAKAVREKGVSFYEYKSLSLSKLQDGLEAHLGPPRWSIRLPGMKGSQDTTSGLSNWRQNREQLDPARVDFTSIYHTDVEATRTVSGCRQIAKGLQVRGYLRLSRSLDLKALQDILENELGFPRWSKGLEWRSFSVEDESLDDSWFQVRQKAIAAYHSDPKATQTLSRCRTVARQIGLQRYSALSFEDLSMALELHLGSAPHWKSE